MHIGNRQVAGSTTGLRIFIYRFDEEKGWCLSLGGGLPYKNRCCPRFNL